MERRDNAHAEVSTGEGPRKALEALRSVTSSGSPTVSWTIGLVLTC